MAEANVEEAGAGAPETSLDPFAHLPGICSRIPGLGGAAPGHDPTYVFHTNYVEVPPGHAEFQVRFEGLKAKRGTLVLRVHMLAMEEDAHAILANSSRIQLNRLVSQGGVAVISFEAFRGVIFALYGSIPDDTDAEAQGLRVALHRQLGAETSTEIAVDPRTSSFGREASTAAPNLILLEPPTLASPVSQMCTVRQTRESVYRDWSSTLGLDQQDPVRSWSSVYVMQVLSRFGMLRSGAYGAGFCDHEDPLPTAISAFDVNVLALERHEVKSPALSSSDNQRVTFRAADPRSLASDVVNFDFFWSRGVAGELGSIAAGLAFIGDVIARLRPGGLALHTLPYDLTGLDEADDDGDLVLFRRMDIERMALSIISRGHEVAQINVDAEGAIATAYRQAPEKPARRVTAYGIIIRKAATAL